MTRRTFVTAVLAATMLAGGNKHAAAQSSQNVLLVVNDADAASRTIGEYYTRKRGIPDANVCRITAKTDETISLGDFDRQIQQPIWRCIASRDAQDRILYIVLTKNVPLRIAGTTGRQGTVASVDSELTLLYRRQTGIVVPLEGPIANPYFSPGTSAGAPPAFTRQQNDIYLVTRLDGFTVDDVIALIDRASSPSTAGRFVLDGRSSWSDKGNAWLEVAAQTLQSHGFSDRVDVDTTGAVLHGVDKVLGYYSWGSNDPAIAARYPDVRFVPGALAAMFVSSDARTFKEPPATWKLGNWDDKRTYYAGSPQSLTGDLIRDGVTGVAGHVAEPFLDATIRPDVLFPAYAAGANLAEAFYLAMPYLSWQTVVVGDPLCAPFRTQTVATAAIDKGLDPATELPAFFSQRRLEALASSPIARGAQAALLRAEARGAHGDTAGSRQALQDAVAADGKFTAARLLLAMADQRAGQIDEAIAQYRAILQYAPNDVIVLNNLAYALAVDRHAPAEALPLAERAVALVASNPILMDTLAWVHHLLGHDDDANRLLTAAAAAAPGVAEIRWHAAVVSAARQDDARAISELDAAIKLDPKLADRDDVQSLRRRLAAEEHATAEKSPRS